MAKLDELDNKLLEVVCRQKCKFYKNGQEHREEEYQCGAYKILKTMIHEGQITLDDIEDIATKGIKDSLL
ncbi:MAG: hypothetical protein ACFFD2_28705 [Promethearchaeota archaeon]